MGQSTSKSEIFPYSIKDLDSFHLYMFEWIDNLNFTLSPKDFLENYLEYEAVVKQRFLEAGWDGEDELNFMWLPPFAIPNSTCGADNSKETLGITIWHLKQTEDGISWLLSPVPLDFLQAFGG